MPFNQEREGVTYGREILRGFGGLDDLPSYVIDSTTVPENPASSGRWVIEKGTVMALIAASDKIQPVTNPGGGSGGSGAYVAADIVGVLDRDVFFFLGPGVTPGAGNAADEPCYVIHMGAHFDTRYLLGYSGRETVVKTGLPFCKFTP